MGGDISYTYLGGNDFKVRVKLYRDCSGIPNSNSQQIKISSTCYNVTVSAPLISNTGNNVTPVCSAFPATTCDSTGGAGMVVPVGVQEYIYETIVTIPGTLSCQKFTFSINYCCRNPLITNIVNPLSHSFGIYSELDRTIFPGNNSPVFYNPAPIFGTAYQANYFDFSALDVDGDSLVYSLYHPYNGTNGGGVNYITGISATTPFVTQFPTVFDPTTGVMAVTPDGPQTTVVGVRVEKYRAGNMVGYVEKDIQIIITNDNNPAPNVSGIDSTTVDHYLANPGDTVSFNVYGSDVNQFQSLTMNWNNAIPGATFTVSGPANKPVGHFFWIVDSTHFQFRPHLFGVTVVDDGCPIVADRTRFFRIYVLNPNTTDVWPGDADNNLVADVYDLLPIGIAYGTSGTVRANASTNWTAQPAVDWSNMFPSTLNYKFADANGDGIVDSLDIAVVNLNYGMTHQKTSASTSGATGDLYIDIIGDTLQQGQLATAHIYLGEQNVPVNDLYGIAFKLKYNPAIVEEGSVTFTADSWMGSKADGSLISLAKEHSGEMDIALSRTNHKDKTGYGKLGTVKFRVRNDINGPTPYKELMMSFTGIKAISYNEEEKELSSGHDIVKVYSNPTGVVDVTSAEISIYPNPAKETVTVETETGNFDQLTFFDIQGKVIYQSHIEKGKAVIDVKDLPAGVYVVNLKGEAGSISKKVMVE